MVIDCYRLTDGRHVSEFPRTPEGLAAAAAFKAAWAGRWPLDACNPDRVDLDFDGLTEEERAVLVFGEALD